MYLLKKTGNIWGSFLAQTNLKWDSLDASADSRVLSKNHRDEFVVVIVAVDYLRFSSNSRSTLEYLKTELSRNLDVKMFGELKSFPRMVNSTFWSRHRNDTNAIRR